MARKAKVENQPVTQVDIGDIIVDPVIEEFGLTDDELVVGTLVVKAYEPGTMSAPAFITVLLDTKDGAITLESKGKLAQYITLLSNGVRVGFFVRDGLIVGVA